MHQRVSGVFFLAHGIIVCKLLWMAQSLRQRYRKLIEEAVDEEDFRKVIKSVSEKAQKGDLGAARLLLEYAWGKPENNVQLGDGVGIESIQFNFARPAPPPALEAAKQLEIAVKDEADVVDIKDVSAAQPVVMTGGRQE